MVNEVGTLRSLFRISDTTVIRQKFSLIRIVALKFAIGSKELHFLKVVVVTE